MNFSLFFIFLTSFLLASRMGFAKEETPQGFTLDGKLYADALARTPLLGTGTLKIQILDSTETCALYEESQSYDTTASEGAFNITVGEASLSPSKRTAGDSSHPLQDLFTNDGSLITGKLVSDGSACTGSAAVGSSRYVRITVTPTSGSSRVLSPNLPLTSIPSALVAERAESLGGKTASQFLQANTTAPASLSQANLESIFSTTNYPILTNLLLNGTNGYVQKVANGTVSLPAVSGVPSSPVAGQIWYDSGTIKYYDGSNPQVLGVSGAGVTNLGIGTGLTPQGTISAGGSTISVDVGISTGQIVQVQSGNKLPALDGSNLTNLKDTSISGNLSVTSINTSGNATVGAVLTSGEVWTNKLKLFDGANSIEFAAPTLSSSTSFTLPATRPGVSGYVLSSDTSGVMTWVPQTPVGLSAVSNTASLAQDKIWIGDSGGKAQEKALSGDVSLVANGTATVTGLRGKTVSATLPTASGQVLRYDGANWTPNFISMFDLRSTVTGSAAFGGVGCLSNQTLTWTSATDNLACSNISLPASQITGVLPVANGGTGTNSLSGTFLINGGQNGAVSAGTNDVNDLTLKTNGSARVTVTSSGNVGIGTTSPLGRMELAGQNISDARAYMTIYSSDVNAPGLIGRKARGDFSAPSAALNGDYLAAFGGRGYHSGGAFGSYTVGSMMVQAAEDFTPTSQGTNLVFQTTGIGSATAAERLRIASNGYVGIGSISPIARLDIGGNTTAAASGSAVNLRVASSTYTDSSTAASGTTSSFQSTSFAQPTLAATNTNVTTTTATNVNVNGPPTAGANQTLTNSYAVRVNSWATANVINGYGLAVAAPTGATNNYAAVFTDGNVGIGTAAPEANLDINGSQVLVKNRSVGEARFHVYNGGATAEWLMGQISGTDHTFTINKKVASVEANFFTIDTIGNVGIGTMNPTAKLSVSGEIGFGNTSSICNATNEGQQRYNSTSKIMQYCNGTSWTSMGGGAPSAGTQLVLNPFVLTSTSSISHGLAGTPSRVDWYLECLTADAGYSPGERIYSLMDTANARGFTIYADSMMIGYSISSSVPNVAHKTTGVNTNLTPSRWKLVITPWL